MDLEDLLAPISEAAPAGMDISLSPEIDTIQEMRREDDPTLDQGEWVSSLKVADWQGVAQACAALLRQRSKDLRVAGWYTEAQARVAGFEGLADGLNLCAGLMERHGRELHPQLEDGDAEPRIGNLRWLTAKVEELGRQIPLVPQGPQGAGAGRGCTLLQVEAARTRRLTGEPDTAALPPGTEPPPGLDAIVRGLAQAGLRTWEAQCERVDQALAAWHRLAAVADQDLGPEAPSFAPAGRTLEATRDALQRLGREAGLSATPAPAQTPETAVAGAIHLTEAAHMPMATGPVQSRAQALEQLRLVAAYFRATEPHSPVAYLADQAIRWGTMPLHDWLRAVVKDPGALAHVEELLGVARPDGAPL